MTIPYVDAEKKKGNPDQFAVLIWHVFWGQKLDEMSSLLRENKIVYEYVPNNMTFDFEALDVTVNEWVKGIMIDNFNKWSEETLRKELDPGKPLDEISIKFRLITTKSIMRNG